MEAGPTLLTMHEGVELLQADVAGLEATRTHKVDAEMFEAAVASLVAADATNATAITTTQSALNSTDQALAALTVEVAGKQSQLGVGFVQGGHSLLEDGAIKAILGTAPVQVTSTATHVEVTMGQSYFDALAATDQALAALTAESQRWRASRPSSASVSWRAASRCSRTAPSKPSWAHRPCR
jgi:hypothetical protein